MTDFIILFRCKKCGHLFFAHPKYNGCHRYSDIEAVKYKEVSFLGTEKREK
jgi:uncharacterized OB-fold protein